MKQMTHIYLEKEVPPEWDGHRLDQTLAGLCPEYSRSQIKNWILAGAVKLAGHSELKPNRRVSLGAKIHLETDLPNQADWEAQEIPLHIIYQDEDILIIDKPAGLVVHPGAGNYEKTLINGLLHYDPELAKVPRAGLVHRLDKETTGLLVVARHLSAHIQLVKNLQERQIKREYIAIAHGLLRTEGIINAPIARHPHLRTKMAVIASGKPAVTRYQILQRFRAHTYLRIELETGRTHQIRVHFAHIGHPLVGDSLYANKRYSAAPPYFHRQALHAIQLTLNHPRSGERLSWTSAIPEDLDLLLLKLQEEFTNETTE
jgi:23S rRNA pseudouridine1911/1915/1917 synthase